MPIIVDPAGPMSANEELALDGLQLNDGTSFMLEEFSCPPPARLLEWIRSADSDGSLLAREPPSENREITARILIMPQVTMNLALAKVGQIVDKLEEAKRNPLGINLVWQSADATLTGTFKVLYGEVTEMPVTFESGWFAKAPTVGIKLTCAPFMEGTEVASVASATSTEPVVTVELANVPGDVTALARIIVTDNATQSRRLVRVGMESRHYPLTAPPALLVLSNTLVTTGFSGTYAVRSGSYSGSGPIRATLATQPVAVCGTGNLAHVGTFRVFARVWASAATVRTRLSWSEGAGPMRANMYTTPPVVNNWAEIDLGLITIPEKVLGTQRWTGQIEAYTTVIGDTLDVDYVYLVPAAEGYAEVRGTYSYRPGVTVARDEFTGRTAGAVLGGTAAPLGGTWTTSGVATDFAAVDLPLAGDETVSRGTVSDAGARYAILGATYYAGSEVGVNVQVTKGRAEPWLIARYVDGSNFLAASLRYSNPAWRVFAYVGGVTTVLGEVPLALRFVAYKMRVVVLASGQMTATLLSAEGVTLATINAYHASLATGGALASGKPGVADQNSFSDASTRYYDNFYAATPAAEPLACHSSQSIEFRSDGIIHEDSTGTYWGPPPAARGGDMFIQPAGTRGRKSRIAVVARRNDTLVTADDNIADSTTCSVTYTPRYLVVPRG